MKQKLLTLLTLLVVCVTGAWADPTYHTITPNMTGTQYETYYFFNNASGNPNSITTGYSSNTIQWKTGFDAWVEGNHIGKDNTGSTGTRSTDGFYADDAGDVKFNGTEKSMIFHVTNCTAVALLCNGNAANRRLMLSVKEKGSSTEVSAVAMTSNNSVTVLNYSNDPLDPSKEYDITINSESGGNSKAFQIRFTAPASGNTLTNVVNEVGWGTVSPTSVSGIEDDTPTSIDGNTYTVGETVVTANAAAATDEYTYSFVNWTGLPATVTESATVTANFSRTPKSYTLAWSSNGGSELTGDYTTGSTAYGTDVTAPNNPTRDGYIFLGWNSANDGTGDDFSGTMPAANTTFYAQWIEYALDADFETYVTDNLASGATSTDYSYLTTKNIKYSLGGTSALDHSTNANYRGLKIKKNGATLTFAVEAGKDVKFTFGYVDTKPTLSIDGGAPADIDVPGLKSVEDQIVTYDASGADRVFKVTSVTDNAVVIKKIEFTTPATKFDVTYKANGSGEEDVVNNVSKVEENMFTYEGHAFTGWNTQADGEGTDYAAGDDVTEELTLFAQWVSTYTVSFNLQGHGSAIDAQEVAEGGKAVEPSAPTASGWNFGGWYEESSCENAFDFNTTISADKTLYAKWTEDVRSTVFSLTFVNTSNYTMSTGDEAALTASEATITGGSASIRFWNPDKSNQTVLESSSKKIYYSTGNMNLKLVLNNALQVGDVISFAGGDGGQIAITDTDESPNLSSNKEVTTSYSYTVQAGDHLVGKDIIYVGRNGTSSTRHGAITISGAAANITVSNLNIEGEKDYATMYYGTVAMAVPAGVKACTYNVVDGKLKVSRTYENGGTYPVIPAGEAVVLEADVDSNTPYMFSVSTTAVTPDANNLLRGTDVATTVDEAGYKYYKLAKNNEGTKVGFYFAVEGGTSINNGTHKAYLAVPESGEAKTYFVLGEEAEEPQTETDGIAAIESQCTQKGDAYNLAGQKVGADYKGIVIVNGKKYLRK